jgi:hypothetical protein
MKKELKKEFRWSFPSSVDFNVKVNLRKGFWGVSPLKTLNLKPYFWESSTGLLDAKEKNSTIVERDFTVGWLFFSITVRMPVNYIEIFEKKPKKN